jgi:hypothetical protein
VLDTAIGLTAHGGVVSSAFSAMLTRILMSGAATTDASVIAALTSLGAQPTGITPAQLRAARPMGVARAILAPAACIAYVEPARHCVVPAAQHITSVPVVDETVY